MDRRLFAFAVALLALAPVSSAAPTTLPTSSPIMGEWLPAVFAALTIAFLIAALAYMIGFGFQLPKVVHWANTELWEVCLSAMMVGIVFFIVAFTGQLASTLTGQPDQFGAATAYLDSVEARVLSIAAYSFAAIQAYAYAASASISFFLPIPLLPTPLPTLAWIRIGITGWGVLRGLSAVLSGIDPVFTLLWGAWFAIWAQRALIVFTQNNVLQVIFPLGLIFRAFPFTRRIGGTMIAMSLALLFAYPLSLALNKTILDAFPLVLADTNNAALSAIRLGLTELIAIVGSLLVGTHAENVYFLVYLLIPVVQQFVLVLTLTVMALVITFTLFRAIAFEVGGDPNIFGSGKLGLR